MPRKRQSESEPILEYEAQVIKKIKVTGKPLTHVSRNL